MEIEQQSKLHQLITTFHVIFILPTNFTKKLSNTVTSDLMPILSEDPDVAEITSITKKETHYEALAFYNRDVSLLSLSDISVDSVVVFAPKLDCKPTNCPYDKVDNWYK
jgi:hypothetical protein